MGEVLEFSRSTLKVFKPVFETRAGRALLTLREYVGFVLTIVTSDIIRVDEIVFVISIWLKFDACQFTRNDIAISRPVEISVLSKKRSHRTQTMN